MTKAKKKKEKQEIDLSGQEFFVTDVEKKLLAVHVERRRQAELGLDYFASALSEARAAFWKLLFELHPSWDQYNFNYNADAGHIQLVNKKPAKLKEIK